MNSNTIVNDHLGLLKSQTIPLDCIRMISEKNDEDRRLNVGLYRGGEDDSHLAELSCEESALPDES